MNSNRSKKLDPLAEDKQLKESSLKRRKNVEKILEQKLDISKRTQPKKTKKNGH